MKFTQINLIGSVGILAIFLYLPSGSFACWTDSGYAVDCCFVNPTEKGEYCCATIEDCCAEGLDNCEYNTWRDQCDCGSSCDGTVTTSSCPSSTSSIPDESCDLEISVNVSDVFNPGTMAEVLVFLEVTAFNNGTLAAEGIIFNASISVDPDTGFLETSWAIPPVSFSDTCPESSGVYPDPISYSCDLGMIPPGGKSTVELNLLLSTADDTTVSYTFKISSTTESCSPSEISDSFVSYAGPMCFIATAAYGSPLQPCVKLLQKFRDRFMLTNTMGKAFVNFYSIYSPDIADFIGKHDNLRAMVRVSLLPFVGFSWVILKYGPIPTLALMLLFGFSIVGLVKAWRNFIN